MQVVQRTLCVLVVAGLGVTGISMRPAPAAAEYQVQTSEDGPTVVTLTQTACQFVEPEGGDQAYAPESADACKALNAETADKRLDGVEPLVLPPGPAIFRVRNEDVAYKLGFYLRGTGMGRMTLPKVSGGNLETGEVKEFRVELKPGAYVYSCPLNPTPNYPLIVREP